MKQTPLKRKTPLRAKKHWNKRSRLRKKSNSPVALLKAELMKIAKKIAKARSGDKCCTCPAIDLQGRNWHGGHFIRDSVGGVLLRYLLENIHSQCFRCNMTLGGNEAEYYQFMVRKYGQEFVDELFRIKNQESEKWSEVDYRNRIKLYKQIAEQEEIEL